MPGRASYRRRWRYYHSPGERMPVKEFIDGLANIDAAAVVAAMQDVADLGLEHARHLRGDIYEVRAAGNRQAFRVLFAPEGRYGQILLALEAFSKKTQKTPSATIDLAEKRLRSWRDRGTAR